MEKQYAKQKIARGNATRKTVEGKVFIQVFTRLVYCTTPTLIYCKILNSTLSSDALRLTS